MGITNEPKEKRNKNIYKDKKNGMSWTEMVLKYGISLTNLRRLYRDQEYKEMKKQLEAMGK